ncbi:Stage III sporulation protein AD [Lentibacillus sp. JNUCC-1]|uniref:stage III sporulation protein AD n=1 Tax=Lentibacillus sp. JNUCC-1 TaxID=2654513 RepID=UPI0012E98EF0|nr:stage III sporulation protein AD [Lentibacillus sp. JNUCC-1]MUV39671.1 Stage III sporulation protein AD [Lentibacillus sp. JNUCC-1]
MGIVQIVMLGMIASLLYLVLKETNGTFAHFLIIITSIIIFVIVISQIGSILDLIHSLGQRANIDVMYMNTILKIIGIAYIVELGANITKDAGLGSVAAKIELAGKVFIIILAIPIITAVIDAILGFLPAV